ncbi:ABC transporter permease [Paenibacillus periandrae]|uniref:ABC transporter permease n=1 Tax=Paenibacillus periandrae TaxID=1761741 RepID=UPI001F08A3A1|nr:ABC-2 family transporter protein [Paenibacillus periandrae]
MTWSLFGKLVQLLMKQKMEYRANFFLNAIAQIINYGASYLILWLFLKRFETIGGWSWPEVALLYSMGLFTYALGAAFSYVQMRELEGHVRNGTFEIVLVKPVNPYFYLVSRGFNLAYIAHMIISGSILIWTLIQLNIEWTWIKLVYFIIILFSGAMIQAGIMTIIGACSFVWVRTAFMFDLFFRLKEFISYPISIYVVFIQVIIVFVVPLAFVNFFPSTLILAKESSSIFQFGSWLSPLVGPFCYWIGYKLWMYSLNKYQGAGG